MDEMQCDAGFVHAWLTTRSVCMEVMRHQQVLLRECFFACNERAPLSRMVPVYAEAHRLRAEHRPAV